MTDEKIIRAIAEQAYSLHLLVKTLQQKGILQQGESTQGWSKAEFEQEFLPDFRRHYFDEG